MRFYFFLGRAGWPKTYLGKILTISFIGVHAPMIGTVAWILLGSGLPIARIWTVLAALLAATLLGTAATLACLYALLTPVRVAATSISQYLSTKIIPSLPTTARDEVGVLMASIQEAITRLDAALDAADARASVAVQQKRDGFRLLSGLSHEFRTPLNHIIGFAEMMSNEVLGPLGRPAYREYADGIGNSGGSLLTALETVLDLSAAEADTVYLDSRNLLFADEAPSALALVHLETEQTGATLCAQLPDDVRLFGDPRIVKQILLHALRAALGGAGNGRTVTLSAAEAGKRCRIEIACDLPWLAEDLPGECLRDLPDTKPYAQTDSSAHPYVSRPALHLTLVLRLVQMSGGQVRIGKTPAGGRAIRIELPATDANLIAARPLATSAA